MSAGMEITMKQTDIINPFQPYMTLEMDGYSQINRTDYGISHFYEFTIHDEKKHCIKAVPDASIDLLFNIGENKVSTYISGTVFGVKKWELGTQDDCFGVRFQPGQGILPKDITMEMIVNDDIEIDGDIFLHNKFVEDHKRLAKPGHYLRGTRVNLGQKLTEEICKSKVNRRIYPWTIGIQNRAETAIHSTPVSNFFADRYKKNVSSGLGCNMSFWRSDFLAINGYDEFFEGWGKEDDDLTHRLQRKGCKKRSLRFAGIVYHLWHGHESMESDQKNAEYFRKNNEKNIVYCENGVSKYLKQE